MRKREKFGKTVNDPIHTDRQTTIDRNGDKQEHDIKSFVNTHKFQ